MGFGRFIFRRVVGLVPLMGLLLAVTFFMLRLAPGGPFDSDKIWPPEVMRNLEARYGLGDPLPAQFARWLAGLARGDLGESFQYLGTPVTEILAGALGPSVFLGGCALVLALMAGIVAGVLAAWKKGSWVDAAVLMASVSGVSLPSYLIASLGVLVFAVWLEWLPPALWDEPGAALLPVLTLAARPAAMIARLTRVAMLEALSQEYIRAAYARGLRESRILFRHALGNSLLPVLALMGPLAAGLLTGSFVVEVVFQVPGLGKHFVGAVINRDYPLVMGVTLLYGVALAACNTAADIACAWADPRVRLSGRGAR